MTFKQLYIIPWTGFLSVFCSGLWGRVFYSTEQEEWHFCKFPVKFIFSYQSPTNFFSQLLQHICERTLTVTLAISSQLLSLAPDYEGATLSPEAAKKWMELVLSSACFLLR